MAGPTIRTDIVDVYVFRLASGADKGSACFLQLRRAHAPMVSTWQPVMGHVRPDAAGQNRETATEAALRELSQETGFGPRHHLVAFWQLESVTPYFIASQDCVMMSPCFAAWVTAGVDPVLNDEHDAFRWVACDQAERLYLWPSQRVAIDQITRQILPALTTPEAFDPPPDTPAHLLRIDLPNDPR